MSGRSQARKSQRELQNVFTAGRGGADQRLAPKSAALRLASVLPAASADFLASISSYEGNTIVI